MNHNFQPARYGAPGALIFLAREIRFAALVTVLTAEALHASELLYRNEDSLDRRHIRRSGTDSL